MFVCLFLSPCLPFRFFSPRRSLVNFSGYIWCAHVQSNRVGLSVGLQLSLISLTPIVSDCIAEHLPVVAKISCRDSRWEPLARLIFRLGVLVPRREVSVGPISRKRVKLLVESDPVHCKDVSSRLLRNFDTMAFEAEFTTGAQVLLRGVIVFNSTTTLNRTDSKAFSISEDLNGGSCKFEG